MEDYCRIYGIMARAAPICVLFRRGPSKWTQLVKWHTNTDTFEAGHWFKGRVYERRCDVSPDGRFLIYFAAKINTRTIEDTDGYTYAWTAISSPPQYKALMLWPKGDCWHGGGLFRGDRDVWLNHRPEVANPHPNHMSSLFTFIPNPDACGEDDPIHSKRLERDGWVCTQEGDFKEVGCGNWKTERPQTWEKRARAGKELRRELRAFDFDSYGGPYVESFALVRKNGSSQPIEGASWAELDQKGKLVFARSGKVFRGTLREDGIKEVELIDLNGNKPPWKTADNSSQSQQSNGEEPTQ